MMDEKKIAELRKMRGSGLISAVGEYTFDELWEALDCIDKLRAVRQAEPEPVFTQAMIDIIYAAWHGAGVDIAGGNWARFVGMLPKG